MKKYAMFALVLVLLVTSMTSCAPATPAVQVAPLQVEVTREVKVVETQVVEKKVVETQIVQAPAKKAPFTVGILHPEMNAFHANISISVQEKGAEMGWVVIPYTAGVDSQKQLDQMDNLIAMGVNAILITPVDAKAICAGVKKAQEAGIPVYGIDRTTIGCKVNMTVQSDNYMGGQQGAAGVVKFLTKKYGEPKGTVLELQGDMASNVAQLRNQGFIDGLKDYPNIKVVSKPTEWDQDKFFKATLDVVGSQQIDAIFSHSDTVGGTPIMSALEQLGKKFPVGDAKHIWVGMIDGSPTGLSLIRQGFQDESYSQPNTDMGIILDFVKLEADGGTIKEGPYVKEGALWSPATIKMSDVGLMMLCATTVVTKENVNDKRLWGNF